MTKENEILEPESSGPANENDDAVCDCAGACDAAADMSRHSDLSAEARSAKVEAESDELQTLRTTVAEMSDKYLRAAAEIENVRRRAALDADAAARARAMAVAENFLSLIDAIDAALNHDPSNEGIVALAAAANSALGKIGITRIESVGRKMNPALHNVVVANGDGDMITQEIHAGYMFGDTVLRPAMVAVGK